MDELAESHNCGVCLRALEPYGSPLEPCWRCPSCGAVTTP
jgi:hypothetical protein